MKFDWWTFTLQAANFLILVWLLQHFLFKPIKAIVAQRKEEIARALTEAAAAKASIELLKQEIATKQSQMDAERQKLLDEARAQLATERQKILDDARLEADQVTARARNHLDEERTAAGKELFEGTIALATNLAERLLRELAVPSIEQPFLGRVITYLDQLASEERAKLRSPSDADALLVTTAHPLDAAAQAAWHDQVAQRLGADLKMTFNADPTLIAGVEMTFPHAILRFNWRDSLATALHELRKNEQPH